jgi:ribonucleoside-diphosphate reductase alpha chain
MLSLCLRHNVPREDILVALTGIDGDNISSLLTAVRKFIGQTIDDGKEIVGMNCSECGETLIMESGCFVCKNCGNSKCG